MEVDCYGPGYLSKEVLIRGLKSYLIHNQYEMVIFDTSMLEDSTSNKGSLRYKGFESKQYGEIIRSIAEDFKTISIPKAIKIYADPWYLSQIEIDEYISFVEKGAYIIGVGSEFIEKVERLNQKMLSMEKIGKLANDLYLDFASSNCSRMISCPIFMFETVFEWSSLNNRENEISLIGRLYYPRKVVKKILSENGIQVCSNDSIKLAMRLLSGLGLKPYNCPELVSVYRSSYYECMKSSKYSFACGMALRMPLGKFFEIPACGAVMIAYPCKGFNDLGFINRKNSIEIEPEEIMSAYEYLIQNPSDAQEIATRGQRLVWEKHSARARAQQLKSSFEAIIDNNFYGGHWKDGDFVLHSNRRGSQK